MSSAKYIIMCLVAVLLVFAILFDGYFDVSHEIDSDGTVDYLSAPYLVYYFPLLIELELYYNSLNELQVGMTNINDKGFDKYIRYAVNPYEIGTLQDGKIIFPFLSIMEENNTDPNKIYDIPNYPFEIVRTGHGWKLRSMTPYRGFGYFDQSNTVKLIYSFFAVTIEHIGNSFRFEYEPITIGGVTLDGLLLPVFEYIAIYYNGVISVYESIFALFDIFGSAVLQYGGT